MLTISFIIFLLLSTTRKVPILTHAVLDFNLGAAPLNSDSHSTYYLLLANTGSVETQWYNYNNITLYVCKKRVYYNI